MLSVSYTKENLEKLCDDFYTLAKYLQTYSSVIHPLLDSQLNPRNDDENLQPPPLKKNPEKQRKK